MKKRVLWTKCLLGICATLLTCAQASAQMSHFYIGSSLNRNEVARAIHVLPDNSCVIAGYTYDQDAAHNIINAQNLLMRLHPDGTIMWQKQWGSTGNDLLFDMIIAQNGDIIAVGTAARGTIYANNHAAIYRFTNTGLPVAAAFVRDTIYSAPGDVFAGVAELANGSIVAVGGHNYTPVSVDAFVSVFSPGLANQYNEIIPLSATQSDHFTAVVANGNSVYLTGPTYTTSTTFYDMALVSYTPGVAAGTINWIKEYDMTYNVVGGGTSTTVNSEWPNKIFIRNNNLLITGIMQQAFGGAADRQYIFRSDMNGNTPITRIVNNSTATMQYSNGSMIYPVNNDRIITTNTPYNQSYNYDQTGLIGAPGVNIWLSAINSLTAATVGGSRQFTLSLNESVQSMDYAPVLGSTLVNLYMAGNAERTAGSDNDIYFGVINVGTQTGTKATCPHDTITTLVTVPTPVVTINVLNTPFGTDTAIAMDTIPSNLMSFLMCGEIFVHKPANINTTAQVFDPIIFPNPVADYMEVTGIANAQYTITNITGRIQQSGTITTDQKISTAKLIPGMYYIQIRQDENTRSFKFVKQ